MPRAFSRLDFRHMARSHKKKRAHYPKTSAVDVSVKVHQKSRRRLWSFILPQIYRESIPVDLLLNVIMGPLMSGFFLLAWAFLVRTNDTGLLSLFMQVRNKGVQSTSIQDKIYRNIYLLDIDAEARLKLNDRGLAHDGNPFIPRSDYDIVGYALGLVGDWARLNPERQVVVGVDYIFAKALDEASITKGIDPWTGRDVSDQKTFQILQESILALPANVSVVFGIALKTTAAGTSGIRMDLLQKALFGSMTQDQRSEISANRIFVGNIHPITGVIKKGSSDEYLVALGWQPLTLSNSVCFPSMPAMMYFAAAYGSEGYAFASNFTTGNLSVENANDANGKRSGAAKLSRNHCHKKVTQKLCRSVVL